MTLEQAASPLGVSRQSLQNWEVDRNRPLHKRLEDIAALYQVDVAWLLTDEGAPVEFTPAPRPALLRQRPVPVISYVQAGDWTAISEHYDVNGGDIIVTDLPVSDRAFALEVEGLSMVPDVFPRDKVIVDPAVTPKPGSLVVAQVDGEPKATLKRFRDRGRDAENRQIIELAPSNPDYPTLRIDAQTPGRVVGTVVELRSYPGSRGLAE